MKKIFITMVVLTMFFTGITFTEAQDAAKYEFHSVQTSKGPTVFVLDTVSGDLWIMKTYTDKIGSENYLFKLEKMESYKDAAEYINKLRGITMSHE